MKAPPFVHVTTDDLERLAAEIRNRCGLAHDDFASAVDVTARIVGPMAIVIDPNVGDSTLLRRRRDMRWEIVIALGQPDLAHRLLHEVAHVVMIEKPLHLPLEEEERAANYIAQAVMAPPDLVRLAHAHHRGRVRPIAKTFGMSPEFMRRRIRDVLASPARA